MIKIKNDDRLAFLRTNNPKMAEKDYLECLILDKLFQNDYIFNNFVFAGGGSLTKTYGLSQRIGQDIDLACANFADIPDTRSKKKLSNFRKSFKKFVFDTVKPVVNSAINQDSRFMIITDRDWNALENKEHFMSSPTLHVLYKSELGPDMGHLCIEIIPRKYDSDTITYRSVQPYSINKEIGNIPTVSYEQTFWDKIYALHSNAVARIPHFDDGFSRHYYDVATLAPFVDLENTYHLLDRIAAHQQKYTTKDIDAITSPSDIVLLPDDRTLGRLSADYQSLDTAFNAPRESWEQIVQMLRELNQKLNKCQGGH